MLNNTENIQVTEAYEKASSNGHLWFISVLPYFGLFLERFAANFTVGIFLWAIVIILLPTICIIDCRRLKAAGIDVSGIKKFIFIPPIYVYKREIIFRHDPNKGIVMLLGIITAIILNGFTQSLTLDNSKIMETVKMQHVTNLDNFSGDSSNIICEQLEKYFGKNGKWECRKVSDGNFVKGGTYDRSQKKGFEVVYTTKKKGNEYKIYFDLYHDGYTYQGFKMTYMTVDGKRPEDKEYKKLMTDIFIPEVNKK